ncbi:unnamed protein product [Rangifer tarandus platyrhynchus]|uniref:Uncharacterized protein n=1 Tax=Rangifer tarandus platyrhynchus TaxID=3082113 RepID=A0ACB1KHE8_RANTA
MWADSCTDTGPAVRSSLSSVSCEEATSTRLIMKETLDRNRLFRVPDEPPGRAMDMGSESHLCRVAGCEATPVVKGACDSG